MRSEAVTDLGRPLAVGHDTRLLGTGEMSIDAFEIVGHCSNGGSSDRSSSVLLVCHVHDSALCPVRVDVEMLRATAYILRVVGQVGEKLGSISTVMIRRLSYCGGEGLPGRHPLLRDRRLDPVVSSGSDQHQKDAARVGRA